MAYKYKIEAHDNNQNIENLNWKNAEKSNIIKNQIQIAGQDTILNINQPEPNLQKNNTFNNYNFENSSIENHKSGIIINNTYYSSKIKSIDQSKKTELLNAKNIKNNNYAITDVYSTINNNDNKLCSNKSQTGKNNINNKEEDDTISKYR